VWQHRDFWTQERVARLAESAPFCLALLAAMVGLVALASGFLPMTRTVLMAAAIPRCRQHCDCGAIRNMAMRAGVPGKAVELWREKSQSLDDIATYRWQVAAGSAGPPSARVSPNFFHLLGAKTSAGRSFERDGSRRLRGWPRGVRHRQLRLRAQFETEAPGSRWRQIVPRGGGTRTRILVSVAAHRGVADRRSRPRDPGLAWSRVCGRTSPRRKRKPSSG